MLKKCFGCQKEFTSNYIQAKFCCKECRFTPCVVCDKPIDNPRRDRKTCSNVCRGKYQKTSLVGENNPNFGKKWSEEKRQAQSTKMLEISELISKRVKNDWASNENRKKEQAERAKIFLGGSGKSHPMWGKEHSCKAKKLISVKSKEKFTEDYKKTQRKKMEDIGAWISKDSKSDWEIYFKECDWIDKMFDIVPNGLKLLSEHGVFHASKNSKGVVRDHIIGRAYGFKHKIYPEIMRHPSNCSIILHSENVSKGQRGKGRSDTGMPIEELFDRILAYKGDWIEQDVCVRKIEEYLNGSMWERKYHNENGEKHE